MMSSETMTAASVYDTIGDNYARAADESPHNAFLERPAMRSLIGEVSNRRVIDLGTGSGYFAARAAEQGAAHVLAVDASERMVEIARARVGDRAEVARDDLVG